MSHYAAEWGTVYNKSIQALRRPGAQAPAATREKLISLYDDVVKGTPGLVKSLERLDKLDADVRVVEQPWSPKMGAKRPIFVDHDKDEGIKSVEVMDNVPLLVPEFHRRKEVLAGFNTELKVLHSQAAKYKALLDKAIKATEPEKAHLAEPYRELKIMSTQLDRIVAMLDARSKEGGKKFQEAEKKLEAALAEHKKNQQKFEQERKKLAGKVDKALGHEMVNVGKGKLARKAPSEEKVNEVVSKMKPQIDKSKKKEVALKKEKGLLELRKALGVDFANKAKVAATEAAVAVQKIKSNPTKENYADTFRETRDFLDFTSTIIKFLAGRDCPKDLTAKIGALRAQDGAVKKFRDARAISGDAANQQIEADLKDFSKLLKDVTPYFDQVAKYMASKGI